MSRVDRFLLSDVIINRWSVASQLIGKRDISDHCLIWIVTNNLDQGPKPFKVNDRWFENKEFIVLVEKEWADLRISGQSDFVLKKKLKQLKVSLRRWNVEVFGRMNLQVEDNLDEINAVDDLLSYCKETNVKDLVCMRSLAISLLWKNLVSKEMILQKSRLKWVGDENINSRYFYSLVKGRSRRNFIGFVLFDRGVVDYVEDVKEEIKKHFLEKFEEPDISFSSFTNPGGCNT